MNDLELAAFPKMGKLYVDERSNRMWNVAEVDQIASKKRFTDAELAAEFEAARCDAMMARGSGTFWAPLGETWPNDLASASERCSTLLRIATADHYDEQG